MCNVSRSFKWVKNVSIIDEKFIKDYCNDSRFILKVDIEYFKELHDLHSDLPFLPKRMKINKCNKLVCILCDKKNFVVLIRNIKQALEHGLKLKKMHRAIAFRQQACLKTYIDMNTELRKEA